MRHFLKFLKHRVRRMEMELFAKILKMKYGRWQKNLSFSAAEQIAHFTFHAKRH